MPFKLDVYFIFITNVSDIIIINKSLVKFTFLFLNPKPSVNRWFCCQSNLSFLSSQLYILADWIIITLRFIIDNLWFKTHQSESQFKVVGYPNEECKEKLTRRDMNNHKMTECVWRKVSCEYCPGTFIVKNKQVC